MNTQLLIRRQQFFIGPIRLSIERSSFNKGERGCEAKSSVKQDLKFPVAGGSDTWEPALIIKMLQTHWCFSQELANA